MKSNTLCLPQHFAQKKLAMMLALAFAGSVASLSVLAQGSVSTVPPSLVTTSNPANQVKQNNPNTEVLDLLSLYREAAFNDPTFNAAKYSFTAGKEKRWQGLSVLLPQVVGTGNETKNDIYNQRTGNRRNDLMSRGWNVKLTQPLFNWDKFEQARQGDLNATIADALRLMKENKIGGIPIVSASNKLVGILTNRDLRFETNQKKKVSEVMTRENLVTAPEGTDLKKAEKILQNYKIEKLPVVSRNGQLKGLITYRDILQLKSFPNAVKDEFGRLRVGAALGITKDMLDRTAALQQIGVDVVCLDSAHGHTKGVVDSLKLLKKNFKNLSKKLFSCLFIKCNANLCIAHPCKVNSLCCSLFVNRFRIIYNDVNGIEDNILMITCRSMQTRCKVVNSLRDLTKTYWSMPHRIEGAHVC